MDFTWLGIQIPICCHRYLKKRKGCGSENQSVSGVTICLMQRKTSPLHRVDQTVYCVLWNVVPLFFNGCAKLLDIGGNWNTLTSIQSIPNMLNGWHVWWACRPWKNWDLVSFQELSTDPWDIWRHALSCWNMRWWRPMNGTTMGLRISSLCMQIPNDKMQLCLLSVA
jgi:hypothetical protein